MFEAQLLLALPTQDDQYKILSPWFQRQGDNATFTVETVDQNGSPSLVVRAFTKDTESTGTGIDSDASTSLAASTTPGTRVSGTWVGKVNELVRYEFTLGTNQGSGEWILFRMLPPVWSDDAYQA